MKEFLLWGWGCYIEKFKKYLRKCYNIVFDCIIYFFKLKFKDFFLMVKN